MPFSTDITDDRDDVFLNSLEFAESITYRIASTDTTGPAILAEVEDEGDTALDDGITVRVSAVDVPAPVKGDQIIRALQPGAIYTVVFIGEEVGMFILDCEREEIIT